MKSDSKKNKICPCIMGNVTPDCSRTTKKTRPGFFFKSIALESEKNLNLQN